MSSTWTTSRRRALIAQHVPVLSHVTRSTVVAHQRRQRPKTTVEARSSSAAEERRVVRLPEAGASRQSTPRCSARVATCGRPFLTSKRLHNRATLLASDVELAENRNATFVEIFVVMSRETRPFGSCWVATKKMIEWMECRASRCQIVDVRCSGSIVVSRVFSSNNLFGANFF